MMRHRPRLNHGCDAAVTDGTKQDQASARFRNQRQFMPGIFAAADKQHGPIRGSDKERKVVHGLRKGDANAKRKP